MFRRTISRQYQAFSQSLLVPSPLVRQSSRWLNLHEHNAKELMGRFGIRVQRGILATTAEQAYANAKTLREDGARDLICKSQILAGGRGKGHFIENKYKGGVRVCSSPEEIRDAAQNMLGNTLKTEQTGDKGQKVSKVLIHEGVDFDKEFYFAIVLDREFDGPAFVGSPMGGMEIEDVAKNHPDQIKSIAVDAKKGPTNEQTKQMAEFLGFTGSAVADAQDQMVKLFEMFMANDCVQVEINPLVQTTEAHYHSKVYSVDAKLGFDEFTEHRNAEIFSWKDESMEDPREVAATKVGLNYVGLDGDIGCMVNGAGLAMATMDVIDNFNGKPANFLDVGGGADEAQVEAAFRILVSDENVKGILVNIFGGIMKCDVIARGIINAAKNIDLAAKNIPLVVRLAGTNVDAGKKLLNESGLLIQSASDLDDAAKKVVAAAKV